MYLDVLKVYKPNFKRVLEHVRDQPSEPFLFHCTGGLSPLPISDLVALWFCSVAREGGGIKSALG